MDEEGHNKAEASYEAVVSARGVLDGESFRYHRQDRSRVEVESCGFSIDRDDGPPICAMITDVTKQNQFEAKLRQAHRLEALGQLTGGIAHDFNNLLTVILGNASALEPMLADDSAAQEMASMTRAAAERAAELISRLLSFSRQQALKIEAASLENLVPSVYGLIRRTLGSQVEIKLIQGKDLWPVYADVNQLENALVNLSINARDAMPHGGTLSIETRNVKYAPSAKNQALEPALDMSAGEYVMIAVSDTGTGMDERTLARAFEPFFTTKDIGKGSGLGLSMVYGFVKQLRGSITIESEIGRGTTVSFYLPRAPAETNASTHAEQRPNVVGGNEKLLLVEDNDLVREHAELQLKRLGYDVLVANDGVEALEVLEREEGIKLLFTDILMPGGLAGHDLARKAWEFRPKLLVLLSSGLTRNASPLTDGAGRPVAMLKKPYQQHELALAIRNLLDT